MAMVVSIIYNACHAFAPQVVDGGWNEKPGHEKVMEVKLLNK